MNQRTTFILGALILAIIITFFIVKQRKSKPVQAATVSVLFATKDLRAGNTLKVGDFVWKTLPGTETITSDVITRGTKRDQDIIGAKIISPLIADQPIKNSMIVAKGVLSPLATVLKPGMRAFTLEVNTGAAVAGLIKPGDTVDVILTQKKVISGSREPLFSTETVAQHIHVIAVDNDILYLKGADPKAKAAPRSSVKFVTLEVTPKQAEMLAMVKAMGTLSLSLAVPHDDYPVKLQEDPAQPDSSVSLYHGAKVEETDGT